MEDTSLIDGSREQKPWYANMEASQDGSTVQIEFFNSGNNFKSSINNGGGGQIVQGGSVKINRDGIIINKVLDFSFLTEDNKWLRIGTNDCTICVDGKYIFNSENVNIKRTGHYEFKGKGFRKPNDSIWCIRYSFRKTSCYNKTSLKLIIIFNKLDIRSPCETYSYWIFWSSSDIFPV